MMLVMTWLRWIGFGLGICLDLWTAITVLVALMLPRRGGGGLQRIVGSTIRKSFRMVAHRFGTYEQRDRVLALQAPLYLVVVLAVWLSLFAVGFGLIFWPFTTSGGFAHAMVISGSSLFTLGFATQDGAIPHVVMFVEAAAGLVVVALQIAYLPVLYAAFNRREVLVTMLSSAAGLPSWGPEILARAELVDAVENLDDLYARWEFWAADVAESHSSYPVLLFFRSPHPYRSWIVGLLATLDAAALHLATRPLTAPAQSRTCLRMGYTCMRELADTFAVPYNRDPMPTDPITLTRQEFDGALQLLMAAGWTLERDAGDAWKHFVGWRVNYEALAAALADLVDAPPAPWSGTRTRLPVPAAPPVRPVDRKPSPDVKQIREITRQRRLIRDGKAVPVRHRQTTPPEIEETWGPQA